MLRIAFGLWASLTVLVFVGVKPLFAEQDSGAALERAAEKVVFKKLSNGIRVVLYERDMAPVFTGAVTVLVGGVDELPGTTGISHMFEHMAFKGSHTVGTKSYSKEAPLLERLEELRNEELQGKDVSAEIADVESRLSEIWNIGEFTKEIDKRGGTGLNAYTSRDLTQYYVNLPSGSFDFWCWIEGDRMLNPVMRQFYKERAVVREERRQRTDDNPGGRLYERFFQVAYLEHPYRLPTVGYDSDLKRLTAAATEDFRKEYYTAENIVVSLVGDLDPESVLPKLERCFGEIPRADQPARRTRVIEPEPSGPREFVETFPASPQLIVGYPKPNYPDPDDVPLSVFWDLLVGRKTAPLYKELVEDKKVVVSIGHHEAPGYRYPNYALIHATPRAPHSNDVVLKHIDRVMKRVLKNGFTERQLAVAKRSLAVQYLSHLTSNESLASDFGESEAIYGNWRASYDWYQQVMDVTLDDIMAVANKYVRSDRRTVGKLERGERTN